MSDRKYSGISWASLFAFILLFASLRGCGCTADAVQREHLEINQKLDRISTEIELLTDKGRRETMKAKRVKAWAW